MLQASLSGPGHRVLDVVVPPLSSHPYHGQGVLAEFVGAWGVDGGM